MRWDGGMGKWSRKSRERSKECRLMDDLMKCRKFLLILTGGTTCLRDKTGYKERSFPQKI